MGALESALSAQDATLLAGVIARDRRSLAKAITLIESSRPDHRQRARNLLDRLLPHTGNSLRIGISGVPGVGKSTFIETFGLHVIGTGHRVAVLAVDPSSSVSGGSILGDKTRMERLSVHADAFIRPSPTSGSLGGVTAHTRETLLACEAAGFDVIIVETVGVGQSEVAVAGMTDVFVLLQLPNAGDELQAMKRGVVELADLIVINKADLDPNAAQSAARQFSNVLTLLRHASKHWSPVVHTVSALSGAGIDRVWSSIGAYRDAMRAASEFEHKRKRQALAWLEQLIDEALRAQFHQHAAVQAHIESVREAVATGRTSPSAAAVTLLDLFRKN